MTTKQQVLGKIADLLNDINSQFGDLENDATAGDGLKADLFEATVNYFAANVTVYNKLQKAEIETSEQPIQETEVNFGNSHQVDVDAKTDDSEEIVFTPNIETTESHAPSADQTDTEEAEIETDLPSERSEEQLDEREDVVEGDNTLEAEDEVEMETDEVETEEVHDEVSEQAPESREEPDYNTVIEEEEVAEEDGGEDEVITEEVVIEEKAVEIDATDVPTRPDNDEKPPRPLSLNERLSAQRRASSSNPLIATRGDGERISDIKSAISLNDKLLFIKDLFNGYSLAYSEAIELLNRYDDFTSADGFLQANYAQKNNWADKPETADKLYAILRKRFG
ncbi:MAG TPA: hypothetical protein VNQ80_13855 [Parapedobacter sp.]|uniref:hypothetical protein n=1 Tax=Parapedobacter sp. TaxID=1958893 RepID=UPI002C4B1B36|nr:hypothetical protein [Parapedobacter sp.]HWK58424.1 hypothetical protein [Parapedobacter sp.]